MDSATGRETNPNWKDPEYGFKWEIQLSRQEREEDARWAERARVVMDEIEDVEVAEINRELDKERG